MRMQVRIILLLLVAVFFQGCATSNHNGKFQPGVIPKFSPSDAERHQRSRALLDQFASEKEVSITQYGEEYLRAARVVRQLIEPLDIEACQVPVYLMLDRSTPNAFALNSHSIIVTSALLNRVTDEQLAVVLAHEFAHILRLHSDDETEQKREERVNMGALMLGTLATMITGDGTLGELATEGAAKVGMGAFVFSYSRAQELEADHIGLLVLGNAGFDPESAVEFWEDADSILGSNRGSSFMSTHPSHGSRKERLGQALASAEPLYAQARALGLPYKNVEYDIDCDVIAIQ